MGFFFLITSELFTDVEKICSFEKMLGKIWIFSQIFPNLSSVGRYCCDPGSYSAVFVKSLCYLLCRQ